MMTIVYMWEEGFIEPCTRSQTDHGDDRKCNDTRLKVLYVDSLIHARCYEIWFWSYFQ